jgi:hypothetical protein
MPEDSEMICKYGHYKRNKLTDRNGEVTDVISYRSVNKIIEGKTGFFNMRYKAEKNFWIIFQYYLDEEGEFAVE